tara:strand:- start:276 stop:1043 length:768 start_codon:yes stop_codon:yes gene_type:complete
MPIWSKPEDEHYRGPATYRLIVNGQNYCGRTFEFKQRMRRHKSNSKLWREHLEKGEKVQTVSETIDKNWDDVVIEIIARYPDKDKDNEEDKLFMDKREIEAIAFYDSFHNGLNKTPGGTEQSPEQGAAMSKRLLGNTRGKNNKGKKHTEEAKKAISRGLMGNQNNLGKKQSEARKQATSQRMTGKKRGRYTMSKTICATMGDKTWKFRSTLEAEEVLSKELGKQYNSSAISKACRGKYGSKRNLHVLKGIHFIYD